MHAKLGSHGVRVFCVVLVVALWAAVSEAAERAVSVTYDFDAPQVKALGDYARVEVAACSGLQRIGEPILPFRTGRILLPPGTTVEGVRAVAVAEARVLDGRWTVEFGRTPIPIGADDSSARARAAQDRPNPKTYSSQEPYPAAQAELVSVQRMCGHSIAIVRVFPVQYVPARGQLVFCPSVRVELTLAEQPLDAQGLAMLRTMGEHAARVAAFVDNPQDMRAYAGLEGAPQKPLVSYDYLLITSAALTSYFQPLVDQKVADGLDVKTETVENILASQTGVDNAEKVRNYIIYAYTTWGISYLLLGGDIATVPYRGAYAYCLDPDPTLPCDLYFSCLDGTWNNDGDGLWGEPNDGPGGTDVDLLGEVYVGRAPVDTTAETTMFVNKIVAYEQNGNVNTMRAQFLAESLGGGDQGGDSLDQLLPHFGGWDVNWLDDRTATWNASQCISALNYPPHIVAHDGHANETYVMRLIISNLDSLTNDSLFLVNSIGCYSGAFDYSDCIAEEFSKRNAHGAFAVIMNSRYGWYASGYEWLFSGEFMERFFYELLTQGHLNVGMANQLSKHDMVGSVETSGDMVYRWCYFEITLFGDPHTPLALDVAPGLHHFEWHTISSPQLPGEPFEVTVTAKDAGGATVTDFTDTVELSGWSATGSQLLGADFETGLDSFTIDNAFGVGGALWHRSIGRGSNSGHSPTHSLYYGQGEGAGGGGNYDAGDTEGVVLSPVVDLSAAVAPITLSFNYFLETELGSWEGYDLATVEVSQDGGPFDLVASNGVGGVALADWSGGWLPASVDLSAYAGSQVQLRFHFATGDEMFNDYEGWYVDDVVLSGAGSVAISPTVSGNFVAGVWTGDVTVSEEAQDVYLRADDGAGHTGDSNTFDVAAAAPIEHGTVSAGSSWTTVNLTELFTDPIVVAGPATSKGWQPGVVRLRNVTPTSFQVKFQEWDYLDGVHVAEDIHWMAVERGTYDLGGGKKLVADKFVTNKTNVYYPKWVAFPEAFSETPVVLTQVQTRYGADAVTDRICGVYLGGIHFSMQEQESKTGHCNETVGYIAVSPGATDLLGVACEVKRTAAVVTHNPYTLTGSQGQCNVRVREEQSKDAETLHWAAEKVGFISLAGQPVVVADMQTCNGADPCELRCTLLWAASRVAGGVVSGSDQSPEVPCGELGRVLDVQPWDAAGPYALLVRAESGDGAELRPVGIAVGDAVAESLPLARACRPGETVTLSAPMSIADCAGLLAFSHWEVDGEPAELGQATIQVEMTGDREAVAVYLKGDSTP